MIFLAAVSLIILGGALGGWANYFSGTIPANEKNPLVRRIVLGISASAAVPLFLNMISSSILSEDMKFQDYFIFFGFCVVAGFSSKAFLSSISKQLLEKVEKVEEDVETMKDSETEPDTELLQSSTELPKEVADIQLRDSYSLKALEALTDSKYTWRSLKGVANKTKQKPSEALDTLELLCSTGLAKHSKSRAGSDIWAPTIRGSVISAWLQHSNQNGT